MKEKNKKKITIIVALVIIVLVIVIFTLLLNKPKGYTVKLMVDDETYLELDNVSNGKKIGSSKEPKKEGYTFLGWYLNDKKVDSDTKISEDLTLEARFEINTYTVTFKSDEIKDEVDVVYSEKVEKPKEPAKKGYIFLGWYLGDEKFDFDTKITKDITLEAKWTKNTISNYTVEHYLMDLNGNYSKTPTYKEKFSGKINSTVTPNTKTYKGFTSPDVETVEIEDGDKTVVKYYYSRNKYTLTLKGDENIISLSGNGTYYYGTKVNIKANLKNGYTINSWSNKETKESFEYLVGDNETLSVTTKLINYNISYVAKYNDKILNNNNNKNPITYTIKDSIELISPEIEGYTFEYWKVNGKKIDGNVIEIGTYGNLNIEAIYSVNTYTVTFDMEDGTNKTLSVNYGELVNDVTLDEEYIPIKKGYRFIGWSLDKETLYNFDIPMGASDITLYPLWETINYKISYNLKDDETCSKCKESYYTTEKFVSLPIPRKKGYVFGGWKINDSSEIINNIKKGTYGDLTLEAVWYKEVTLEYIDSVLLTDIVGIQSYVKDNAVSVGIIDYDKYFNGNNTLIDLSNNIKTLLDLEEIDKLEVVYNNKPYILNSNVESLKTVVSAILGKETIDDTDKYSDLFNKKLNVKIYLKEDIARTTDNKPILSYSLSLEQWSEISKETFKNLGTTTTNYINSHKKEKYEVVDDGNGNLIFKYSDPNNDVFSTMMGAGLKTAMQTFLGNENIGYVIVTFRNMDPVKVTYDDIKENKFWDFGFQLLDTFEAAVGKDAFDLINSDLDDLKATIKVYAHDGRYFGNEIVDEYTISFKSQK